jgi:SAM-dependent methyltransferase
LKPRRSRRPGEPGGGAPGSNKRPSLIEDHFRDLLACPSCQGELSVDWACTSCGLRFDTTDGIPNLRLPPNMGNERDDDRTEIVRRFYDRAPFPGYPARDSLQALRARAGRNTFVRLLDRSISSDARIVEIGCGTGQMSLYLARADRLVIGADLTRASLELGAAAARRFALDRVQFVETDLQRPGLRRHAFDIVYCSGVLHHTANPGASFSSIAQLARPGGLIVVGVYNAFARIPTRLRRLIARLTGFRLVPFDPVLSDRQHDPARRDAWLRDQYQHPEEHSHTLAEVRRWLAENRIDYLRTYPSTVFPESAAAEIARSLDESENLFSRAADDWTLEAWLAQLGWMWTLGREGGLFYVIGRRALQ